MASFVSQYSEASRQTYRSITHRNEKPTDCKSAHLFNGYWPVIIRKCRLVSGRIRRRSGQRDHSFSRTANVEEVVSGRAKQTPILCGVFGRFFCLLHARFLEDALTYARTLLCWRAPITGSYVMLAITRTKPAAHRLNSVRKGLVTLID